MRGKAFVFLLGIILLVLIFSALGGMKYFSKRSDSTHYKVTDSQITVDEKKHSEDWKKTWIIVHDPNNSPSEKFEIIIEDKNTWNLINIKTNYFASYEKKGSIKKVNDKKAPYHLSQIVYPDNPDNIPLN
ncbi:hypothetical protein [Heyndrickxia vini]|uniref:Uncharacterized protein n=1 Tax=Heyndrickxia vini TaxID=1476025 RepID=A0ABX7E098_9BACI|nr:hypothetical protein [Heyndrickxia vini]QQZ08760.1 hypothetical protein I5776_17270 [Heyndrickxia vini]